MEVEGRMKFVLQHIGEEAARNGCAATRRQIMREWDKEGKLESNASGEGGTSPIPWRSLVSNDHELEKFFEQLDPREQSEVEAEVQKRLEGSGLGHLGAEHPARARVRRTVTREWLKAEKIPLFSSKT